MVKVFYGLSMRKFWCILLMAQMLSVGAETLRVMQLNVWNSGYGVPGARVMIGDEIKKHRPDIVFLCECVKDRIVDDLLAQLKSADLQYYGSRLDGANQVISRFPIVQEALLPSAYKAVLNPDNGQKIVAYSVHLNYRNYACYLPRGYSGETWKKVVRTGDRSGKNCCDESCFWSSGGDPGDYSRCPGTHCGWRHSCAGRGFQ